MIHNKLLMSYNGETNKNMITKQTRILELENMICKQKAYYSNHTYCIPSGYTIPLCIYCSGINNIIMNRKLKKCNKLTFCQAVNNEIEKRNYIKNHLLNKNSIEQSKSFTCICKKEFTLNGNLLINMVANNFQYEKRLYIAMLNCEIPKNIIKILLSYRINVKYDSIKYEYYLPTFIWDKIREYLFCNNSYLGNITKRKEIQMPRQRRRRRVRLN